ncbi:FAD binding domain protein [Bordetella bronchiseptica MBORD591]|nr:FAD binding domain protein [Bordetella bronchiseptica MBORD591]
MTRTDAGRREPLRIAVMGGGIAGMVFAARAAELGGKVVVLEQGDDELYRCNTRYTGGAFHLCFHDIDEPAETLATAIKAATADFATDALTEAIAADARHAVRWLQGKGIRLMKAGPDAWRQHFLAPPSLMQPGLHWQGRGGDMLLRTLRQRLEADGGRLLRGARVTRLLMAQGRCAGVEYERHGARHAIEADLVMLADGGFQANMDMLRQYVSPAPEKLKQRGAGVSQGDAIRLAQEAGAALVGMENIYGHLLCQDALHDDRLWPYPIMDMLAGAGIVVGQDGRRVMDEGLGGVYMTNALARLPDPQGTVLVFDRAIWEGPATEFILPANPYLPLSGGTVQSADTLPELAARTGVDADGLAQTVLAYNAALARGATAALVPPRSAGAARPIAHPPYHAVRLVPGITFTMGGIAIDGNGQVLQAGGAPVPGLYAAGCCTGGFEGGARSGYVGGLTKSATISWRAAAHALARS